MTPEQLAEILANHRAALGDIVSFILGGIVGISFVIASSIRWDS